MAALLAQWEAGDTDPAAITAADWYARFRRLLAANEIALSTPLRTGIQVLEAHEAALVPFAHTFLIHANDGEFPKSPGPGWLFTDQERRALAEAGSIPPLQHCDLTLARERALWRAVASGPATTITYRTADANGVPLLPSLLVPEHDQSDEIPRTRFIWPEPFNAHHADRVLERFHRVGAGFIPPLREFTGDAAALFDRVPHSRNSLK